MQNKSNLESGKSSTHAIGGTTRYLLSSKDPELVDYYQVAESLGSEDTIVLEVPNGTLTELAVFIGEKYSEAVKIGTGAAVGTYYIFADRQGEYAIEVSYSILSADGTSEREIGRVSEILTNRDSDTPSTISPQFSLENDMAIGERLVQRIRANTVTADQVISLAFGGTIYPSRFVVPLVKLHNDLDGLQGGIGGEFYHLTQEQHDKNLLNDGDGSNLNVNFVESQVNENLTSGEALSTSLGKLSKWHTDLQPVAWSGSKADIGLGNVDNTADKDKPVVTTTMNGLMSSADKIKLDGITDGGSDYVHPSGDGNLHVPATGTTNDGKVLKAGATAGILSWGTLTKMDVGLGNVDNTSDMNKPISTATQVALDGKASTAESTPTTDGLMSSEDKSKLDGISAGANNYVHPSNDGNLHVPVTGTTNNGRVLKAGSTAGSLSWGALSKTDVGLGNVDNTADKDKPIVTTTANGLMSSVDKIKLDGIPEGGNDYIHPSGDGNLHVPATGTTNNGRILKAGSTAGSLSWGTLTKADVGLGNVDNTSDMNKPISTATQVALDGKASTAEATVTTDGLMSSEDKSKLDGISVGANNYVHPSTHPPSIIVQDTNNRFVTDSEKNTWNGKLDATAKAADSNLLDGLDSSVFVRNDVDDVVSGIKTFTSSVICEIDFQAATNTGNFGFVVTSNGYVGCRLDATNSAYYVKKAGQDNTSVLSRYSTLRLGDVAIHLSDEAIQNVLPNRKQVSTEDFGVPARQNEEGDNCIYLLDVLEEMQKKINTLEAEVASLKMT